jgi:hypothetical protein
MRSQCAASESGSRSTRRRACINATSAWPAAAARQAAASRLPAAISTFPRGWAGPVPVQFLGQSRHEQFERRIGRGRVEQSPRLEEIDSYR